MFACLSMLSDCAVPTKCKESNLVAIYHNLNHRADSNGIRAETGNRTPLFGWNANALPMSYFRKCLSIPSCQWFPFSIDVCIHNHKKPHTYLQNRLACSYLGSFLSTTPNSVISIPVFSVSHFAKIWRWQKSPGFS